MPSVRILRTIIFTGFLLGFSGLSAAQTKPPAPLAPPTAGLKDGWEEIDQRLVFLTVELSTTESEIDATNKALKANGYKLASTNDAAEHARKGNEIMDRNGGGPVPWKDFYGKTASAFFYHPTDDNTVHVNPLPIDQRPPQFDYIYRANLENQAKAEEDADKIGNKIDDLVSHKRDLETEQSALWCKIAFRAVASKEITTHPLYRYEPRAGDGTETSHAQAAAIKAGAVFVRAIDAAMKAAETSVDTDQKGMLDTLKETSTTARGVLQDALLGLPRIAVELDDPRSPIGRFSRSAKRLADSSENMVDAYRMAAAADGQDDQISRSNTRGQLQQMIFDYASTIITADQSLTAAARAWRITPDITKSENGSASTEKVPGKTADSIPAKLDAAKAAYQADLSNARRSLIAAIDIRLDAATDAGDLATVQSLQAAKTSAARDGTLPEDCKDASVLAAKTKMTQSISAANDRMAASYRDAVKGYTRARQITEAIAVQDEFHASGLDAPATGGSASESTATPAPGEGPKETASASPSPTGFTPPVLPDGLTKIKLPAAVDTTAVGSGGRYLILHLKKLQQLAVFDVSAAKVIKYLPLPTNDIVFTAGEKKLFIGLKDLRQVQRWDLQKLEMELSVAAPEGGVGGLAMGAEATTPLLMIGDNSKHFWLVNPNTLHAEPYPSKNWGTEGSAWGPTNIHVSFDGSTAAANGGGWAGVELSNLAGGKVVNVEAGSYVNGDLSLAGNGSLIFHDWDNEIVRADLTSKVTGIDGHAFPADDPALSLSLLKEKKKAELVVFSNADPRPLITLRGLTELSHDSKMKLHDRIHLIPRAHVLITLGDGNDELILRKFDLAEELDAEGTDYLFVQSAPLCFIERGGRYVYKISALSKKGGVTYTLQSGPKGMAIDKDGTVKWSVPSRFPDDQTQVIVQISDASGQTIFHSYSINIADRITKR